MNNIYDLLKELKEQSGPPVISKEEYEKAARDINKTMEEYDTEWRAYMAQSIESAKHAYITF